VPRTPKRQLKNPHHPLLPQLPHDLIASIAEQTNHVVQAVPIQLLGDGHAVVDHLLQCLKPLGSDPGWLRRRVLDAYLLDLGCPSDLPAAFLAEDAFHVLQVLLDVGRHCLVARVIGQPPPEQLVVGPGDEQLRVFLEYTPEVPACCFVAFGTCAFFRSSPVCHVIPR
jgi:hypothetical protein